MAAPVLACRSTEGVYGSILQVDAAGETQASGLCRVQLGAALMAAGLGLLHVGFSELTSAYRP